MNAEITIMRKIADRAEASLSEKSYEAELAVTKAVYYSSAMLATHIQSLLQGKVTDTEFADRVRATMHQTARHLANERYIADSNSGAPADADEQALYLRVFHK